MAKVAVKGAPGDRAGESIFFSGPYAGVSERARIRAFKRKNFFEYSF
jgi:hypothetical protein